MQGSRWDGGAQGTTGELGQGQRERTREAFVLQGPKVQRLSKK